MEEVPDLLPPTTKLKWDSAGGPFAFLPFWDRPDICLWLAAGQTVRQCTVSHIEVYTGIVKTETAPFQRSDGRWQSLSSRELFALSLIAVGASSDDLDAYDISQNVQSSVYAALDIQGNRRRARATAAAFDYNIFVSVKPPCLSIPLSALVNLSEEVVKDGTYEKRSIALGKTNTYLHDKTAQFYAKYAIQNAAELVFLARAMSGPPLIQRRT